MAIKIPGPPDDAADAVRAAAEELLPVRFPRHAHAESSVEVSPPIAVLSLGLDALLQGAGLDAARQTGWRHIVRLGNEPVALADVDTEGGSTQVRQVNYGPYVASVARAAERSRRAVEKRGGEARLVQVPALYMLALWHQHDEGGSTVVVLDPAPAPFEPGQEYDADEFLDLLREVARGVGADGSALPEPAGNDEGYEHDDKDDDTDPPRRRRT